MNDLLTTYITAAHVRDGVYIGPDVSAVVGNIEIAADLGWIKFAGSVVATGRVRALSGSGIEAGGGIEAGWGIEAGLSVVAKFVSVKLRIFAGAIMWRLSTDAECEVRAELRGGVIAHGTLVSPTSAGEPMGRA